MTTGASHLRKRWAISAAAKAITKPIVDRDERQHDVLHERGLEHAAPVVAHPVGAEEPVLPHAVARLAEVRDHRPGRRNERARSRREPPAEDVEGD